MMAKWGTAYNVRVYAMFASGKICDGEAYHWQIWAEPELRASRVAGVR